MTTTFESLNLLLRCQLTAVHQQFIHMLALLAWDCGDSARRITEIDSADFPNAMNIIAHLVSIDAPVDPGGHTFSPGQSHRGALVAEYALERCLAEILGQVEDVRGPALEFFQKAAIPRPEYLAWLEEQLARLPDDDASRPRFAPESATLFGYLLAMVEQAMIHAFVHLKNDRIDLSDACWASSGAAMMQATGFIRLFAARHSTPAPEYIPKAQIAYETDAALMADRQLAERCAKEASRALGECRDDNLGSQIREIAGFYQELAEYQPDNRHPAEGRIPAKFGSFKATLEKFGIRFPAG